jgi:hypothetical protein
MGQKPEAVRLTAMIGRNAPFDAVAIVLLTAVEAMNRRGESWRPKRLNPTR